MKAWMIWLFYAIMTAIFAVIGFFIGRKYQKAPCFAMMGITIGIVLSVILWFTVGENAVKSKSDSGY